MSPLDKAVAEVLQLIDTDLADRVTVQIAADYWVDKADEADDDFLFELDDYIAKNASAITDAYIADFGDAEEAETFNGGIYYAIVAHALAKLNK